MPTTFHQQKRRALAGWPPAGIDPGIREVCERINRYRGVWTTQSCEGHVEDHPDGSQTVSSGCLWLRLSRPLRRRQATLGAALTRRQAELGVEQAGMIYGREPWPTFEVVFRPGRAEAVGEVVTRWLDEQGMGSEESLGGKSYPHVVMDDCQDEEPSIDHADIDGQLAERAATARRERQRSYDEQVCRLWWTANEDTEVAREIRVTLRPQACGWLISESDRVAGPLALDEAVATVAAVMLDEMGERRGLASRMETVDEHRERRERLASATPTAASDDELPGMWSHADLAGGWDRRQAKEADDAE